MREIKFRAWDEQYGMLYGDKLEVLHGDIFTGLSYGNLFVARKADYENDWREFKVMQYTGLKGKNGKDIYEGDIYHQGDKNIKYVVVYRDSSFVGKQLRSSSYAGLEYWRDRIEIIGNIYENPELIES